MATMLEVSHMLAAVSAVLLIIAIMAAISPRGREQFKGLNGSAASGIGNLQTVASFLLPAVGLSAVAAILAFADFAS